MDFLLLPRGIRNNNPGNIRLGKDKWQGSKAVQSDLSFVEFDTPVMGMRALMYLLLVYYRRHGLDTVESIINRWAPPRENATDNYIYQVSKKLKLRRRDILDLNSPRVLIALAGAIVCHENGPPPPGRPDNWYDAQLYKDAATMAQSSNSERT